nr:MAG TPA_asm: hypothetical protein [Caudoviricetes sp.]
MANTCVLFLMVILSICKGLCQHWVCEYIYPNTCLCVNNVVYSATVFYFLLYYIFLHCINIFVIRMYELRTQSFAHFSNVR